MGKIIFFLALDFLLARSIFSQNSSTRMAGTVCNRRATDLPKPEYPPAAKVANIKGKVEVVVSINEFGNVEKVKIISGHTLLHKSAIEAAKKAKFNPQRFPDNRPIKARGQLTYNFN